MTTIFAHGHQVEVGSQQKGGKYYAETAEHSNYLLVQTREAIYTDQRDHLDSLKLHVLRYIVNRTYLCRYEPVDLTPIRKLPFVVYANVYHPDLVIARGLKARTDREAAKPANQQGKLLVSVMFQPHKERLLGAAERDIEQLLGLPASSFAVGYDSIAMDLTPAQMRRVAALDEVLSIHEEYESVFFADEPSMPQARFLDDVCALQIELMTNPDGKKFMLHKDALGDGETIGILDGPIQYDHPAFQLPARRMMTDNFWNTETPPAGFTPRPTAEDSHGTIVASIAAGSYVSERYKTNNPDIAGSTSSETYDFRGVAPAAKIQPVTLGMSQAKKEPNPPYAVLSCATDLFKPPSSRTETDASFRACLYAFGAGAKVINQSFGTKPREVPAVAGKQSPPEQGAYDARARDLDQAQWDNEELLIVKSAGNEGKISTTTSAVLPADWGGGGQICGTAASKNVITVGMCVSSTPMWGIKNGPQRGSIWPPSEWSNDTGWNTQTVLGDPDMLEMSSSRGPALCVDLPSPSTGTPAGDIFRHKPDVIAPGAYVLAAKSQQDINPVDQVNAYGWVDGTLSPQGPASKIPWKWEPLSRFSFGSSMAAPVVTGCCAIIRSQLKKNPVRSIQNPSAALVKAFIVNGAEYILNIKVSSKQDGPKPYERPFANSLAVPNYRRLKPPDYAQGFGRVNLCRSLIPIVDGGRRSGYQTAEFQKVPFGRLPSPLSISAGVPIPELDPTFVGGQSFFKNRLNVTMCYTDFPGFMNNGSLMNKLHMKVSYIDAGATQTLYANTYSPTVADTVNNVQKLIYDDIPGTATGVNIIVEATDLDSLDPPRDTQSFAVVWFWDYMDPVDRVKEFQNLARVNIPSEAVRKFKEAPPPSPPSPSGSVQPPDPNLNP